MERLAMMLYKVPDIRCFWSEDPGFKNQFVTDDVEAQITYRVSQPILSPKTASLDCEGYFLALKMALDFLH